MQRPKEKAKTDAQQYRNLEAGIDQVYRYRGHEHSRLEEKGEE